MNQEVNQRSDADAAAPGASVIEMEVFRAGDYGARGRYTEADLEALAADYQPELLEAPLTFDHAQSGPAHGWVRGLRVAGGRLLARIAGVPEAVRALLRDGAYKKRSVEIVRPLAATGRPYLRAVSLLGAASPAVAGLRDVAFSASPDDAEVLRFDATEALEQELRDARTALETARCEAFALQRRRAQADATEAVRQWRVAGVALSRADESMIVRLAEASSSPVVAFAADGASSNESSWPATDELLAWLGRFLGQAAVRVPTGEAAAFAQGPDAAATGFDGADAFASSDNAAVEPRSQQLHERALGILRAEPTLSYTAALLRAAR